MIFPKAEPRARVVKRAQILARAEMAVVEAYIQYAVEYAQEMNHLDSAAAIKEYTERLDLPKYQALQVYNGALVRIG